MLVSRWAAMGIDLLVFTGFIGVPSPRAAAVAMPADISGVAVVGTLTLCVYGALVGDAGTVSAAVAVLVMVVLASLS